MTTEERDFIKGAFGDSSTHIFDKGEDAERMRELLDRLGVKHEIGSFHHVVKGKGRFDTGINIKDSSKLTALLNAEPSDEKKEPVVEEQPTTATDATVAKTAKNRRKKKLNL